MREGVNLITGAEVDAVNLVNNIAQQITADHTVLHAFEDVGNDFALTAFFTCTGQTAQVREQTHATTTVWTDSHILVDKRQQFITRDAIVPCGPVAPAV